ncbi:M17 family metallopeptidase [Psychrobium sp. 1_MG-2023]|uniref:leucyl aminopeptidase family protein n=1 Tax=Psychrobium sp. 1_MG-2023 TaxID=3062624 RepID=UPI000C33C5C8|nr:leucyl aminopeptidase family protein [Psychrobium sp. 1_MG-2023]MDP2560342.1 leucyl aminopeptidase family protein [Psychrobium sp. 1_MG-2023]PKF55453.1 leucyl aminopeptidase [Alteromonadales bacterium alter-6D02]
MFLNTNIASGTPLYVLDKNDFITWETMQDSMTINWLINTKFSGHGVSIIPNTDGSLRCVIFVTDTPSDHFACGDLATQLPSGHYVLNTKPELIKASAFGWLAGCYRFTRYKESTQELPTLAIKDSALVNEVTIEATATALVRDLVNTPAADMMPQNLAETAHELTRQFGGSVTQIVGDELLSQNYPTIHAVGRASVHQPQLIDLIWGDDANPQITLVGKGVCFDSGGLDLKPTAGMRYMKKDMGGSAHVLGLAHLIMANNLPVRLRVLIPAVENAVSANALRPGDVITTRSGLTVEIDNTDAEGRLVLCDAISEAMNDSPEMLIDFATLTGAMRVALGTELPGFFSSNKQTALDLMSIGESNSDPVWNMPLHSPYKSLLKSEIADMSNCAAGPFGGAITAALYLKEFTANHPNWLHFDIMAWNNRKLSGRPIGGEAFGVRTVYHYLAQKYAK